MLKASIIRSIGAKEKGRAKVRTAGGRPIVESGRRAGDPRGKGVLLAALPFDSGKFPSLALSLLKAGLIRQSIACDVRYFSLEYIERIGWADFCELHDNSLGSALLGEWIFAEVAHGEDRPDLDPFTYLTDVLAPACPAGRFSPTLVRAALAARSGAASFIDDCVRSVDWSEYAVLGLSSSFQQNMASLAFARRVKAIYPHMLVVFGGPNCSGEMGEELHRQYRFIDVVCLGEGDFVFPALVRCHLSGEPIPDLPGIVRRAADGSSVRPTRAADQVENLDELPYPDHSDFYAQRSAISAVSNTRAGAVFESARGCWWGMKNHCTFCGINGRSMSYRCKSQARAYDELIYLIESCGTDVLVTDAILSLEYFSEFLPRLAKAQVGLSAFWQMKVNLRPEWIALLASAGVNRIQPGIEALDTELLKLMRKGCTMLQNVQTLKLAAEAGISVAWNLLYGFPGEDPASYSRTAVLIRKLRHLQPAMNMCRTFADRFSPYFQHPEAYGVTLEPLPGYQAVYPFGHAAVRRLAYHFRMHSPYLDQIETVIADIGAEYRLWKKHQTDSELFQEDDGDRINIVDRRWGWEQRECTLNAAESHVLRTSRTIAAWPEIVAAANGVFPGCELSAAARQLVKHGVLLSEGSEYLALPLRQPGPRRAPTWSEVRDRGMVGTGAAGAEFPAPDARV